MDVLATVVNVSTLCQYIYHGIISIRTTIKYIRDLPDTIKDRSQYLASLASIVEQIAQTRTLQTTTIEIHLNSVKDNINSLRDLVLKSQDIKLKKRPKRLWKAYRYGPGLEDKTAKVFTYLEQSKSNLQLYIMTQYCKDKEPAGLLDDEGREPDWNKSPQGQQDQNIQATTTAGREMVQYQSQGRQQEPTAKPTDAPVEQPRNDDKKDNPTKYDAEDRRKFCRLNASGNFNNSVAGDRTDFIEAPRSEIGGGKGSKIDAREFKDMSVKGHGNNSIAGDWKSAKRCEIL